MGLTVSEKLMNKDTFDALKSVNLLIVDMPYKFPYFCNDFNTDKFEMLRHSRVTSSYLMPVNYEDLDIYDIKVRDRQMLEDLIVAAVNAAMDKADEVSQQKVSQITGGLNGLF